MERTTIDAALGARMVRNVVDPTVEVYLPDPGKASGTGIVIAPGGAYRFLSYDSEGVWVAQWLAEHGIAAFVLKYRVNETSADDAEAFRRPPPGSPPPLPRPTGPMSGAALAGADGLRAMELVRSRAADWGVRPDRIGIMGFSAGAGVTMSVVKGLADGQQPLFAAPIYGGAFGEEGQALAAKLPPFFLAVSADDALASSTVLPLFQQLISAGHKPELHVYHSGGHGWGMQRRNQSLDHWIQEFHWWLQSQGFVPSGLQ